MARLDDGETARDAAGVRRDLAEKRHIYAFDGICRCLQARTFLLIGSKHLKFMPFGSIAMNQTNFLNFF
jgi:hypothetical protein